MAEFLNEDEEKRTDPKPLRNPEVRAPSQPNPLSGSVVDLAAEPTATSSPLAKLAGELDDAEWMVKTYTRQKAELDEKLTNALQALADKQKEFDLAVQAKRKEASAGPWAGGIETGDTF